MKRGGRAGKGEAGGNRITRKHLDFVICDRATCVPVLAIELDDASHGRADRQTRDLFVDGLCRAAGLPLVRQPARRGYTLEEVRAALAVGLAGSSPASAGAWTGSSHRDLPSDVDIPGAANYSAAIVPAHARRPQRQEGLHG